MKKATKDQSIRKNRGFGSFDKGNGRKLLKVCKWELEHTYQVYKICQGHRTVDSKLLTRVECAEILSFALFRHAQDMRLS